jgi:hypothetical protein
MVNFVEVKLILSLISKIFRCGCGCCVCKMPGFAPRFLMETTSLFFQISDYDPVHEKNICKMCIVKFSFVDNL